MKWLTPVHFNGTGDTLGMQVFSENGSSYTSFNVRGEPIVCTPEDAFRCFMGNELDLLVVGNCFLDKAAQAQNLKRDYSSAFDPD